MARLFRVGAAGVHTGCARQNEDIVRSQRKEIRELTQKFNAYRSS